MIDNELGPDVRALLAEGRERLGPDTATIARLRSRIDAAVAAAPASPAKAFAVKLTVVAVAATVGAGLYRAQGAPELVTTTPPPIAAGEPEPAIETAIAIGVLESVPPEKPAPLAPPRSPMIEIRVAEASSEPSETIEATRVSLAREIELVDRATLDLRQGAFSVTLDVLATYERETGGDGQLALEATAIKVEALCRMSDPRAAAQLAAFSQRWPRSAQRSHLTATCAKEKL